MFARTRRRSYTRSI